jgi:RNase P/RNase MRP subunit p29
MYSGILIGNKIHVIHSSDLTLKERRGFVLDETRNMLKLAEEGGKNILVPKAICEFVLELEDRKIALLGKEILGTPQERIHKI